MIRFLRSILVAILADIIVSDSGGAVMMADALWIVDVWLPALKDR
jgi:hypothetical protein